MERETRNKQVRLTEEKHKEFSKLLIDLGKSFQEWVMEKIDEEFEKAERPRTAAA